MIFVIMYYLPSDDDNKNEHDDDIHDIDKKLEFSWNTLVEFILQMMKKHSFTRVTVNKLLKVEMK